MTIIILITKAIGLIILIWLIYSFIESIEIAKRNLILEISRMNILIKDLTESIDQKRKINYDNNPYIL